MSVKKCARCQKQFTCTNDIICWCNKITLDETTLSHFKKEFIDCLCEDCLKIVEIMKR